MVLIDTVVDAIMSKGTLKYFWWDNSGPEELEINDNLYSVKVVERGDAYDSYGYASELQLIFSVAAVASCDCVSKEEYFVKIPGYESSFTGIQFDTQDAKFVERKERKEYFYE